MATAPNPKKHWWAALALRERIMVAIAGIAVLTALLWFVALGPALKLWKTVDKDNQQIDSQILQVQKIGAQVKQLQAANRISFDAAYQALSAATKEHLPENAQVNLTGDQATVTLTNANAHYVAQWLAAVRNNARAIPVSAQLTAGTPTEADAGSSIWSGTIVFRLPPRE